MLSRQLLFRILLVFIPFLSQAQPCREVSAYFPSWKWYSRGQLVNPATIHYENYSTIIYAFFQPNWDGSILPFDPWADKTLLLGEIAPDIPRSYGKRRDFGNPYWHDDQNSLVKRAHDKGVKVVISVGGWTMSDQFSGIAANAEKRRRFAQSCNDMIRIYGIDGIDIDWEYPGFVTNGGSPSDKYNFTYLLQTIRDSLDALEFQVGRHLSLTAAFGVAPTRMAEIEWAKVTQLLDHINLMTYDFYGNGFATTNHNAPLYSPEKGLSGFDTHSAVHHLMEQYGVPSWKINIGLAFYGRSLKTKGAAGLHVSSRQTPDARTFPEDSGTPMYYNILARQDLFQYHWDSLAQAPYLKGKGLNTFVTYEDERSIAQKANYIIEQNLAGAIIWDITGDCVESQHHPGRIERTPLADALLVALCQEDTYLANLESARRNQPELLPPTNFFVTRNAFAPRIAHEAQLSKKEKRKLKRKQKKLAKMGQRAVYFDTGW
ncbi:MAG: glycoside hydrolase family 18 protein [Lewinellaceae bacterium]|nr:glycoside hydrolase family 18 protein [Saprospiraceae bacterium]MCB9338004.1 glycoside hydrolase family 18 protein [Lewinellaceae bacterium]